MHLGSGHGISGNNLMHMKRLYDSYQAQRLSLQTPMEQALANKPLIVFGQKRSANIMGTSY